MDQIWMVIATGVITFVTGAGLTNLLKYRAAREKTITEITERVRQDAMERQKVADRHIDMRMAALEAQNKALDLEVKAYQKKCDDCERKCTECDVARLEQQREIEELRRLVMKSETGEGLAIVRADEKGIITAWNEMASVLFKWTWREALGQHISMLMPERYQGLHEAAFGKANTDGVIHDSSFRDFTAMDNMGNELPVSVRLSIQSEHGTRRFQADIKKRKVIEPPVTQSGE